ncbi:MAG: helix-turn-helix domain-containing protein [Prevotellaceae bacterium]|jgi:AraC-like DNA-binding protein|nr:helix-turn-helix domain-containing protein [Prevotellaceae bacterium]
MEKKITPLTWQIDVKNRVKSQHIGSDFILFDDFSALPMFEYPFKLDMLIILLCTKGSVRGRIGMHSYYLSAPFAIIVRPNQVLHHEYISPDFAGHGIVVSQSFASEILPHLNKEILIASTIREKPYAQLSKEALVFIRKYFKMLKVFLNMTDNPYRIEMVKHLTMVFYYWARPYFQIPVQTAKQPRQALLVEEFVSLVQENYRRERDTVFYADKLCLTPKYLSQVIKSTTGKSAAGWIDGFVVLEAKALLKSTNMTIQQISDELNFPSQSFFGKYFKRCEGLSPKAYRSK